MNEKQLLANYVKERANVDDLEKKLSDAKLRKEEAEQRLIAAMEQAEVTSTANYEEFGKFTLVEPSIRVSIEPGMEDEAYAYIKEIGEEGVIKSSIHWATLAKIIKKKFEQNEPLPEAFKYYFQQTAKYFPPK